MGSLWVKERSYIIVVLYLGDQRIKSPDLMSTAIRCTEENVL